MMTDIEKVLTEVRPFLVAICEFYDRVELDSPTDKMLHEVFGPGARAKLVDLLAAFTADMPGAIGGVVEALKYSKCWCGQLIDRDDCSRCAALAELEGK